MHLTRLGNSKIPKCPPYGYKSIEHLKERRVSSISQQLTHPAGALRIKLFMSHQSYWGGLLVGTATFGSSMLLLVTPINPLAY